MPAFFPIAEGQNLSDSVLLNRAIYGGNLELPDSFLNDYDPARDPSNAGIRADLNVYDRYDDYLADFGFQTLGATELGFAPSEMSFADDNMPGDGAGVDRNWFYAGDLYRNHHVQQEDGSTTAFEDAAAIALAAVRDDGTGKTLHLVFRGTDADLGSDGEAGTGVGQVRYYGQLEPLIDKILAYVSDPANGITDVVVSGHSLGGAMVDMFALYHGAAFDAVAGVDLHAISLASAGIDPATLVLRSDYDASLVQTGMGGITFITPPWYSQYDNADDIVRNPERYDLVAHTLNDPAQAPITRGATLALIEHVNFEENRLEVESPFLDQYAAAATLETTFLPAHYASYYELIAQALVTASENVADLDFDRIIALGGQNPNITETSGTNNANGFGVPEDNAIDLSAENGDLAVLGLSGDDSIATGSGDDLLAGGEGNDTLDGGAGADVLDGGAGKDTASYANAAALVKVDINTIANNVGDAMGDTLLDIEVVFGSAFNDDLRGSDEIDSLYGSDGNDLLAGRHKLDFLDGGAGNDILLGGLGADILMGGEGRDFIRGDGGIDRALYVNAASAVLVDLVEQDRNTGEAAGDNISLTENLDGSDFADDLRGDARANHLRGRDGDDTLRGRGGDDTLEGARGADSLIGGSGADTFLYSGLGQGGDTITDFVSGLDRIAFDGDAFDGLPTGTLVAGRFVAGTAALDADDRFIYNQATGRLTYDADGSLAGEATLIAVIAGAPALSFTDIEIV